MLVKRLPVFGAILALTACSGGPQAPADKDPAPPPPRVTSEANPDPCGGGPVQDRVGRSFSESLRDAIVAESGAERVRVLRPGDAATMDHRPDRLNIHLDDNDVIARIECG